MISGKGKTKTDLEGWAIRLVWWEDQQRSFLQIPKILAALGHLESQRTPSQTESEAVKWSLAVEMRSGCGQQSWWTSGVMWLTETDEARCEVPPGLGPTGMMVVPVVTVVPPLCPSGVWSLCCSPCLSLPSLLFLSFYLHFFCLFLTASHFIPVLCVTVCFITFLFLSKFIRT